MYRSTCNTEGLSSAAGGPGPGTSRGPAPADGGDRPGGTGRPWGPRSQRLLFPRALTAGFTGAGQEGTALSNGAPSPWGSLSPLLRTCESVPLTFLGPFKKKKKTEE